MSRPARTLSALVLSGAMLGGALVDLRAGVWPGRGVPTPAWDDVRSGAYVDAVEQRLEERSRLRAALRARNAELVHGVFGTLQQGVVEGPGGWLHLPSRMTEPGPEGRAAMARSVQALGRVHRSLAARDVALVAVVTPRACTVHPEGLPSPAQLPFVPVHDEVVAALRAEGVPVPDVAAALRASPRRTYLRNDAHWRPEGALVAARAVASFLRAEVFAGATPPGTPVDLVVERAAREEPYRGQELRRLGFTEGSAAERPFLDTILPLRVVRRDAPDVEVLSAAGPAPIVGIGTSMSGDTWPFFALLMADLGVEVSSYVRAGFAAGYRGVDLARYWASGVQAWPEVVVWEIPEDFFRCEGRYLYEPLESMAELLEAAPLSVELLALDDVAVEGAAGTEPAGERRGLRAAPATALEPDLTARAPLAPGTLFHLELGLPTGRAAHLVEARVEWFGGPDGDRRLGGVQRVLRTSDLPHAVVVRLDAPADTPITRVVVHPADRESWVEFGRPALFRPGPR